MFQSAPVGTAKLGPADVISITVFREPDLSVTNATVDADGMLVLPLIGSVHAAGSTPGELASLIEHKLANTYLRDPHVSVSISSIVSHKVTVEGAVTDPGIYDLLPGTKLSGAIAMAKGPSRVAKLNQIAVFRQSGDAMYVARFDYNAMEAGTMIDPVLQPGDRIVFGTSALSQGWQDFLRTVPLIGVFTRL
ncbi:polysaccharide biosynthesis/export family protein [Novosphingobium sp. PC22D]|uniref:polysaccharide biosynthesis/export family protein n=1 Tax=Novosphingobium sp. PC22D TaxID=1962403 RepID=UPI00143A8C54|nr:polysaccharide biosynthesis/export family protein [Novosphingobium sp. PC22D]